MFCIRIQSILLQFNLKNQKTKNVLKQIFSRKVNAFEIILVYFQILIMLNFLISGTKVVVSNLQPSVSQEDIVELFGDVGPLKRAKVTTPGTAEVVFVNVADALKAIEVYHNRQLDGRSMKCQIVGLANNL